MRPNKEITAVSAPQKNLQLVQVLRGVASMLVVLLHVTNNLEIVSGQRFCFNLFLFGGSGVDIFFVLSGFIITYTSSKGLSQPAKMFPFIRRRLVRIFPTYWIIITLFLIAQLALPSFYKTHYSFSIENLLSTLFLLPGHAMVNGVSWTLSFELLFYLLFAIAFIIPTRKWAFYLFMIYALLIIAIPVLGYDFENGNAWIKLISYPMNVEFFMGVAVAIIIPKIPGSISMPLIITGCVMFIANGILSDLNYYLLHNSFNRVLVFGVPSFLIIAGLVSFELHRKIEIHNALLLLGEASYSLYLLHLPLVVAAIKIIGWFNIQNTLILHVLLVLVVAAICFISVLFYQCIEKPVINKLNGVSKNKGHPKTD